VRFQRALPCGEKAFAKLYRCGYTPAQAEENLGISIAKVHNWFRRGKFRPTEAALIGRVIFALPDALERVRNEMEHE